MAESVYVNNQKALKAGEQIKGDETIEVRDIGIKYVSRGGLKLEKALKVFPIDLSGKNMYGYWRFYRWVYRLYAEKWSRSRLFDRCRIWTISGKLRTDDRVINMERTNFRYVTHDEISDDIDFSVDVSFISLKLILPPAF